MGSRAFFAQTSGVQEGSSIVYVLSVLSTPLFFLSAQMPHFPYRLTGGCCKEEHTTAENSFTI